MGFSKIPNFDPLEARTGGFTGSMGGKSLAGVGFGPKPTPDPNFTKIGLGHRTGPYIRSLHFLTSGLLNWQKSELRGSRGLMNMSTYQAETNEEVRANETKAAMGKKALSGAVNRAEEQFNHQGRHSIE